MEIIGGEYAGLSRDVIRNKVKKEIRSKPDWYRRAGMVCLGMWNVTFDKGFEKLQKPRTVPDELVLYALCIMFRRHAMVHTSIRPWYMLKRTKGLIPNIASEMCEMILIYLGGGIFDVLRQRPFSIELPPIVDLDLIQRQCVLYWDTNLREMNITLNRDDSFEDVIHPE